MLKFFCLKTLSLNQINSQNFQQYASAHRKHDRRWKIYNKDNSHFFAEKKKQSSVTGTDYSSTMCHRVAAATANWRAVQEWHIMQGSWHLTQTGGKSNMFQYIQHVVSTEILQRLENGTKTQQVAPNVGKISSSWDSHRNGPFSTRLPMNHERTTLQSGRPYDARVRGRVFNCLMGNVELKTWNRAVEGRVRN